MISSFIACILLIILYSTAGAKEKQLESSPKAFASKKNNKLSITDQAIKMNLKASKWIDSKAQWLDLALSGARYTDETENSTAVLSQTITSSETEGMEFQTDFDLSLKLPNFKEKYKVMISSYNENKTRRSTYSRLLGRQREDRDYGANISFFSKIGDFDTSFRPRIQFGNPFQTFYTLQLESEVAKGRHLFNSRFDFFADSEKGTGQFIALQHRYVLSPRWSQLIVLEEEYQDGENIFSLLQGYTVNCIISRGVIIAQSFVFSSDNDEQSFGLKDISMGPTFTHELLPDVFHYSLTYTHSYNREFDFKGKNAATLVLDFIF